ncbi:MAG TPA: aspartyl protease family protein [Pyrinomonadaceae bacterium]|jgi:hypothetical protein
MSRKVWALCLLFYLAAGCACASSAALTPRAEAVADKSSVVLPFDLIDNRIVINVRLNGKGPFRFIFDSGAGAVVAPEVALSLGLKIENLQTGMGGVGEKPVERGETRIADVEVGTLHLADEEFGVLSFDDTKYVFGANRIDGILGFPVFKSYVVRLDYERRQLTFTPPAQFSYRGNGTVVPLDFDRHLPLVRGELDNVPGVFVIDTGARSALILYNPFVEQNDLRRKYGARFEGITGWGIGGPVRSQIVRIKTLKLGGVEVRDLVARLSLQKGGALTSANRAALVGPDVLKQFTTVFDYSRRLLIFEKNAEYGKPDSYDRAGVWLGQEGDHFEVIDVIAGGPAAEAGLRVGDQILEIDGTSAAHLDLPAVRLRFKNDPPKKRVRLVVSHDGQRRELVLVLRDLV